MANFKESYDLMLDHEGGLQLTDIKNDQGGRTFAGISERYHPNWAGWEYVSDESTAAQVWAKQLTEEFYEKEFWQKIKGDEIKNQYVANTIFDFAVNVAPEDAIKAAQEVCMCEIDGIIGPITLSHINSQIAISFVEPYALQRIAHRLELITKNPGQKKFITGWLRRDLESAGIEL